MKRIDERDTMFARMTYRKGSKEYKDYYNRNPEKSRNGLWYMFINLPLQSRSFFGLDR